MVKKLNCLDNLIYITTVTTPTDAPKQAGKKLLKRIQEEKPNSYRRKVMHGYFRKTIELDYNIDKKESQQWLQDKYLTSHFRDYVCAVEEQEQVPY